MCLLWRELPIWRLSCEFSFLLQESNAEKALVALKQLQPQQARVCRSGAWRCVSASSLVPGDLVDLRCGDKVPADCRVVELKTASFRIEQSQLTGESVAVLKVRLPHLALAVFFFTLQRCTTFAANMHEQLEFSQTAGGCMIQLCSSIGAGISGDWACRPQELDCFVIIMTCSVWLVLLRLQDTEALPASMRDCEIQSQRCLCFSSTTVARGRALAVVVRTGMATQIGIIQAAVHEAGESDDTQSPLQQKLDEFGEALSKVICGVCVVVWLINIGVRTRDLRMGPWPAESTAVATGPLVWRLHHQLQQVSPAPWGGMRAKSGLACFLEFYCGILKRIM